MLTVKVIGLILVQWMKLQSILKYNTLEIRDDVIEMVSGEEIDYLLMKSLEPDKENSKN